MHCYNTFDNMKYNILYVNLFPHIGGAETSLIYLIQQLDKTKFEPHVIVPHPGLFSERLKQTHAKVYFLNLPGYLIQTLFLPGTNPVAIWKFYNLCKKIKPDLIHLNHITQAIYAGIAGKLLSIPVVSTSWVNADSIYIYQNLISRFALDKILPVHPGLKERLVKNGIIPAYKIDVIYPGLDTKKFHPVVDKEGAKAKLGLKKDHLIITIASRFDPTKDHLTFLRAMSLVLKQYSTFTVLIAQDPQVNLINSGLPNPVKLKIYEYLNQNPRLKKRTRFIGYQKNMLPVYHATDILVSSSIYESLGIILIEASLCGLPVVTTNYDSQKYVIKDNDTGFLVPIYDHNLMAKKILILAKNPDLRKNFGEKTRKHSLKHFSISQYLKKIENAYLSVIKNK